MEGGGFFYQLHRLHHTFHHLFFLKGVYFHTEDLLNLFFSAALNFLASKREAFVEMMALVEEASRPTVLGLAGELWRTDVAFLKLWDNGDSLWEFAGCPLFAALS